MFFSVLGYTAVVYLISPSWRCSEKRHNLCCAMALIATDTSCCWDAVFPGKIISNVISVHETAKQTRSGGKLLCLNGLNRKTVIE